MVHVNHFFFQNRKKKETVLKTFSSVLEIKLFQAAEDGTLWLQRKALVTSWWRGMRHVERSQAKGNNTFLFQNFKSHSVYATFNFFLMLYTIFYNHTAEGGAGKALSHPIYLQLCSACEIMRRMILWDTDFTIPHSQTFRWSPWVCN